MIENLHEVMHLLEQDWARTPVMVVGDVMLDRYIWGDVERISPEAPVPIVRAAHRSEQPGGAANVAMNLAGLGAQVTLLGFTGKDTDHYALEHQLKTAGVTSCLISTAGIPTTSKLRILGGNQQMLRLDTETNQPRPESAYAELLQQFHAALPGSSVVVLSDYAKGVLTEGLCRSLIEASRGAGIPVLVDPKSRSFDHYRGATTICPNLNELALAVGEPSRDIEKILASGQRMLSDLNLEFLAVTLSEKGIAILYPDRRVLLPAVARNVFDVSGAGDTVIATLALGLAGELPVETSAQLANIAAGIVVSKVGTVPIQKHELIGALSEEIGLHSEEKVLTLNQLLVRVSSWRSSGRSIVFTAGCYDILHIRDISFLAAARRQGDKLVVGIHGDKAAERLNGSSKPTVGEREHAQMLAALTAVDSVVVFEEDTPLTVIEALRPEVLVSGGNYSESLIAGAAEVRSWGGTVKILPLTEDSGTIQSKTKTTASSLS